MGMCRVSGWYEMSPEAEGHGHEGARRRGRLSCLGQCPRASRLWCWPVVAVSGDGERLLQTQMVPVLTQQVRRGADISRAGLLPGCG